MNKIINNIKNILFPCDIKCIICGCELNNNQPFGVCEKCQSSLPFNNKKVCEKCGNPINSDANYCISCKNILPKFTMAFAPLVYEGDVIKLIHNFKYENAKYLSKYLSKLIYNEFLKHKLNVDLVYAVPLYSSREKQRGYNQAYLLCQEFKENGFIISKENLIRVKDTQTQTHLSYKERQENLQDAFKVLDKKLVKGQNILLIDDVFTTGSTLNHASEILIKSGAKNVYCLTIAHVNIKED